MPITYLVCQGVLDLPDLPCPPLDLSLLDGQVVLARHETQGFHHVQASPLAQVIRVESIQY